MKENPDPNPQSREDEWLAVRCQLGERPAFDELIERWNAPLWEYLRRATGEDEAARDLLQDVWLRVLRGIGRLRDGSKLRPWLFGIARRTVMDRWRTKFATPVVSDLDMTSLAKNDAPIDLEEDLTNLQSELARLPFTEREALTLFYLKELSLAEVAEVLAVPVGTVKSRLFRARRLLRDELEGQRRQP